jgi:DNA-binding NarL/FixJ family response regulator
VIRVLVVDDHAVVRAGLASLLATTDDLQCVGATGDGLTALELVDELAPDVVLLDLSMPGLDGVGVTSALRRTGRSVPVQVLTSYSNSGLVVDAVRAGADGYLLKQSEAEVILDGVRTVADGQAPVDPAVAAQLMNDIRYRSPADELTEREHEVLEMVRQGHPNKSIARRLQISERTVKAHVTRIFQRIGVSDRTQAALWAERHLSPRERPRSVT